MEILRRSPDPTKVCTKCKEEKRLGYFGRHKGSKSCVATECLECTAKYNRGLRAIKKQRFNDTHQWHIGH